MRKIRKDKIWTAEFLIKKLISNDPEDRRDVRTKYFRYLFYQSNNTMRYLTPWEFCRKVSNCEEDAFKAWMKCTKCQKDHLIECALKWNPNTYFIFDGKILLN